MRLKERERERIMMNARERGCKTTARSNALRYRRISNLLSMEALTMIYYTLIARLVLVRFCYSVRIARSVIRSTIERIRTIIVHIFKKTSRETSRNSSSSRYVRHAAVYFLESPTSLVFVMSLVTCIDVANRCRFVNVRTYRVDYVDSSANYFTWRVTLGHINASGRDAASRNIYTPS